MNSKTLPSDSPIDEQTSVDYWRLFRELPDPLLLFEAREPNYTIIEVNKVRESLGGFSREDYVGHPLFETYPFNTKRFSSTAGKDLRKQLRHIVRTGRSFQIEPFQQNMRGVDGTERTAYLQGYYYPIRGWEDKVKYILAVVHDVTEELHARERVATAESRLNAALTIGKVGSWVFDLASRRIIGDDNFKRLFKMTDIVAKKYSLNDFIGSVRSEDRRRVLAAVKRSIKMRIPFEEECRVTIDDGTEHYILSRGRYEEHEGQAIFSGVVVDLTEQHSLQEQVEEARKKYKLNQRMTRILQQRNEELEAISRSKDEFVALASHQLRTPATAVKQYIGMVLQGYVGDINEEQADVLARAFESNERQIQIINQILSAARADTGKLVMMSVPIDLGELVEGIAADMDEIFKQRQQTFSVAAPKKPVIVECDIGYLRMAIENVIHNANVYTPIGGSVTLRLRKVGSKSVLSVSDTGVGIKNADIGKLFVKFSRIHNPLSVEAGGSGIGLYLAAEIVRLHGGELAVNSQVGKGSTFAISLPLMQNKESESRAKG